MNFCSGHEPTAVRFRFDILVGNRLPVAGPAGAGIKFGFRLKKRLATTDAVVGAFVFLLPVGPRECSLCAMLSRDTELLRGELILPLVVRFLDLLWHGVICLLEGGDDLLDQGRNIGAVALRCLLIPFGKCANLF